MKKRSFVGSLLLSCLMLLSGLVLAQEAQQEILTNRDVIAMSQAGLSNSIIVSKIRSSAKTDFKLTTDDLMKLKQDKLADEVIEAMLEAHSAGNGRFSESAPAAAPREVKPDPNNPADDHDAGIYFYSEENGKPKLTQLEPSVASKAKTSGMFTSALTYGIGKIKIKTSIPLPQASLQVNTPRPVFYFYFEVKNAGLSNTAGYATSPKEFMLVQLSPKKNAREVTIGQGNIFGAEAGTMDKDARPFDYEKIGSGIYKITLKFDLKPGEYGFYQTNFQPGTGGKIFDFGVKLTPAAPAPTAKP